MAARVFISYSHQDEVWKDRVAGHLLALEGIELDVWDDRRIRAGEPWREKIEKAIAACDVALLLVSRHFLNSRFIAEQELPPLLQRDGEDGLRVIPVILADCQWHRRDWLGGLQARPTDGHPLNRMTPGDADAVLSALAGEVLDIAERLGPLPPPGTPRPLPPEAIAIRHLPAAARHFLGRDTELERLDAVWAEPGCAVVTLIAPGGVGKTSLLNAWLDRLRAAGWGGARRVFGWSFYSQGSGEDRQASEDLFVKEALEWFGVEVPDSADAWTKGQRLAEAVAARRTLLLLDGVEPLQYPPGPLAGELRAPGLKTLLEHLARAGQPGLCLVTSREGLADLAGHERGPGHPERTVLSLDLGALDEADGARLLHALGARRAGEATIESDDEELQAASRAVQGHALTLALLGRYLALAYEGDIRKRDQVDLKEADDETGRGHAFRVMAAYERWFESAGEQGARELAALRLLGFFDRPAPPESLAALREPPAIEGLTEPLVDLSPAQWNTTLTRLREAGLLYPAAENGEGATPATSTPTPWCGNTSPTAWPRSSPPPGARATPGCTSSSRPASPTTPRGSRPCNRSTRRWPTAAWPGGTRRPAPRCTATASCAAWSRMVSTAPDSSAPSVPTWGRWPACSRRPGGAPARP